VAPAISETALLGPMIAAPAAPEIPAIGSVVTPQLDQIQVEPALPDSVVSPGQVRTASDALGAGLDSKLGLTASVNPLGTTLSPIGRSPGLLLNHVVNSTLTELRQAPSLFSIVEGATETVRNLGQAASNDVGLVTTGLAEATGVALTPTLEPAGIESVVSDVNGTLGNAVGAVRDLGSSLPSLGTTVTTPGTGVLSGILPSRVQGTGVTSVLNAVPPIATGLLPLTGRATAVSDSVLESTPDRPTTSVPAHGSDPAPGSNGSAIPAPLQETTSTAAPSLAGGAALAVPGNRLGTAGEPADLLLLPAGPSFEAQSGVAEESASGEAAAPVPGLRSGPVQSGAEGAGEGLLEPETALAPRAADLAVDLPQPDLSGLRRGMQQLFGQLNEVGEGMTRLLSGAGLWTLLAAAAVAAISYELARRRQQHLRRELALAAAARDAIPPWWLPGLADGSEMSEV
jgi:hypothetical protein